MAAPPDLKSNGQSIGAVLLVHAQTHPEHIAVQEPGRTITYAQFALDFRKTVRALSTLTLPKEALRKRALVGIEWDGLYRHWLLLLGFETLGIATTSYVKAPVESGFKPVFAHTDLALGPGEPPPGVRNFLHTDETWWAEVAAMDPIALESLPPPLPKDQILRVISGSGTTGAPKLMAATAGQIAYRREATRQQLGFTRASRYLIAMSLLMQADYRRAMTCLLAGGTTLFTGEQDLAKSIRTLKATHSVLMPRQVFDLSAGPPVPGLTLSLIGARATPELRSHLRRILTDRLVESYGTNETGSIATVGEDGLATLVPGVAVSIVDPEGNSLPKGQPGTIRVRGPGVIDGYWRDAAATRSRFQDGGWFLPGDIGVLEPDGRLRLVGRSDEILNVLGLKLLAPEFEGRMTRTPEIRDAALAVARIGGEDTLCVLAVPESDADWARVERIIRAQFTPSLPRVLVARVNQVPRTENGKVRRGKLREMLQDILMPGERSER